MNEIKPGDRFGRLTIIGLDEDKSKQTKKKYYICKCSCQAQTIKSIRKDHLTSGATLSCGCIAKEKSSERMKLNKNDLTGQQFGRLIVLKDSGLRQGGHVVWECQCNCDKHTIVNVVSNSLISGDTKSCGCYKHEVLSSLYTEIGKNKKKNLIGKKFGHLTVLEDSGERCGHEVIWTCQCDCKNKTIRKIIGSNLTSGHTQSCGCLKNNSINNSKIANMLTELKISFEIEKSLKYQDQRLYADFWVEDKYIIEYDGSQHFWFKGSGWNTKENFNETRRRDLIKNKYCFDNNIPLIRIPYDAEYTIDDLKLETTRFLLTPENEQEYYESRK